MGFGAFGPCECSCPPPDPPDPCDPPCEYLYICYDTITQQIPLGGQWVCWDINDCCPEINCYEGTGVLKLCVRLVSKTTDDPEQCQTTWIVESEVYCEGSSQPVIQLGQKSIVLSYSCDATDCFIFPLGSVAGCPIIVKVGNSPTCTCDNCDCTDCDDGRELPFHTVTAWDAVPVDAGRQRNPGVFTYCTVYGQRLQVVVTATPGDVLNLGDTATVNARITWMQNPDPSCEQPIPHRVASEVRLLVGTPTECPPGDWTTNVTDPFGARDVFSPITTSHNRGDVVVLSSVGDTAEFHMTGVYCCIPDCSRMGAPGALCFVHSCTGEWVCHDQNQPPGRGRAYLAWLFMYIAPWAYWGEASMPDFCHTTGHAFINPKGWWLCCDPCGGC